MDIAEKIMAIKTEIIDEVKQENNNQIEKKRRELKKEYNNFQEELDEKQDEIIKNYENRAEQKREQIISRAILEKKNLKRKKLNDSINNFIQELHEKLDEFTSEKDYCLFIFNSIKEAAKELPDKELTVLLRENDSKFKSDLEELLEKEMSDYSFEMILTEKIKSGGFIIKAKNNHQMIESTFAALIDSFREEIAIELKNDILTKK